MIVGVTHNEDSSPIVRLTVAFKVSIGKPVGAGGSAHPSKLDHFRILYKGGTTGEWTEDVPFTEKLRTTYMPEVNTDNGKRRLPLREFDIVFLSDDIDEIFKTEYAWWSASEKKCSGNGMTAMRSLTAMTPEQRKDYDGDGRWGEWTPCGPGCPELDGGKCKPSGQLFFMFKDRPVIGSVASYTTTSYETVRRIHSSLNQIQNITGGRLKGIPFKLVVRPGRTRFEQNGQVKTSTAYFVNVEFRQGDYADIVPSLLKHSVQYDKAISSQRRMLAEHVDDDTEPVIIEAQDEKQQAQDMTSEFYPENRTETGTGSTVTVAAEEPSAGEDMKAIDAICSSVGLNDAQKTTLLQCHKGDIAEVIQWLGIFKAFVTDHAIDNAAAIFTRVVMVAPDALPGILARQVPAKPNGAESPAAAAAAPAKKKRAAKPPTPLPPDAPPVASAFTPTSELTPPPAAPPPVSSTLTPGADKPPVKASELPDSAAPADAPEQPRQKWEF